MGPFSQRLSIQKYKIRKRWNSTEFLLFSVGLMVAYGVVGEAAQVDGAIGDVATQNIGQMDAEHQINDRTPHEGPLIVHASLSELYKLPRKHDRIDFNAAPAPTTVRTVSEELGRKYEEFLPRRRGPVPVSHYIIRNTSELHVDSHVPDEDDEEVDVKRIPAADYAKKVVVFQKPFHFHLPIFSPNSLNSQPGNDGKRHAKTYSRNGFTYVMRPRKQPVKMILKRGDYESSDSNSSGAEYDGGDDTSKREINEDVTRVPKASLKGNERGLEIKKRTYVLGDDSEEAGGLIDVPLSEFAKTDESLVRKREASGNKTPFSQEAVDKMLAHDDDWVKFKDKITKYAKSMGKEPEEVFQRVVDGTLSGGQVEEFSTPREVYQRRLLFHKLFLDDANEVEKYQVNEVQEEDGQQQKSDAEAGPYYNYMKVLKRSRRAVKRTKRGLKTWLKKVFTGNPPAETPIKAEPGNTKIEAKKEDIKPIEVNTDGHTPFKQKANAEGDTAVDKLLPGSLKTSAYVKTDKELKKRKAEGGDDDSDDDSKSSDSDSSESSESSDSDSGSEDSDEDDDDKKKKKKKRKNGGGKKKRRDGETKKPSSGAALPVPKSAPVSVHKRSVRGRIDSLSKEEMGVVLEMMINMIEYQCAAIDNELVEGLVNMTHDMVAMTGLDEYIARRRKDVDTMFQQMLECSANREKIGQWMQFRLRNGGDKKMIKDAVKWIGNSNVERPLRRKKRVRRQDDVLEVIKPEEPSQNLEESEKIADSYQKVIKIYFALYQIIADGCFNMEVDILRSAVLIFADEIGKLKTNPAWLRIFENFTDRFDYEMVETLLTKCYEAEVN